MVTGFMCVMALLMLPYMGKAYADDDKRQLVEMPAMIQSHILANMRDHLAALNDIL